MDSQALLVDDLDTRPTKRQRTESPLLPERESSTNVMNEPKVMEDSGHDGKAAITADDMPLIPGLGSIMPDVSENEAKQSNDDNSNDPGLLDSLIRHVDSQSNVQNVQPQQSTEDKSSHVAAANSEHAAPAAVAIATTGKELLDSGPHISNPEQPHQDKMDHTQHDIGMEPSEKAETGAGAEVLQTGRIEPPQAEDSNIQMASSENEVVQPSDTEKLEHNAHQKPETSVPSTVEVTEPDIANLRDQLPAVNQNIEPEPTQADQGAEWEIDSSPINSSSDSDTTSDTTSTDDSDEDDADVDGDYAMLDPEEQARILMQGDGGSDDEGNARGGTKGEATHLRTANEKPEEVVPKPDIKVTEDMKIEELGTVEGIVENTVLVKAKVSGEYRVLESNSLLCLQDRSVVGVVSETLGRVEQPLYTIRFTNDEAIKEAGLFEKYTPVYYVEQHSTFVFTQPLRAVKGSDASNFHDEEVGADEMEFSNDEAEAEHKRQLKLKKQGRKDERSDRFGNQRGKRGGSINGSVRTNGSVNGDTTMDINYDDVPPMGDEGYTPLARPTNLHELIGPGEAPVESHKPVPSFSDRGHDRGRGRGRGRGDRGSRGGRGGRGRGGWHRSNGEQPRDRKGSFSNGMQTSQAPHSEPASSTTSYEQQQQQFQNPAFALPPIPPPSQYPYPQITHQQQHPPFPYQNPNPPQAPTITPQPSSYSTFSPSPISPLPQGRFSFNNYPTHHNQHQSPTNRSYAGYQPQRPSYPDNNNNNNSNYQLNQRQNQNQYAVGQNQHQQMPPPGSHINPAFFEALRQQQQQQYGGAQK